MKRELFEKDKTAVTKNLLADAKSITNALTLGTYNMDEAARLAVYGCDDEDDFRTLYTKIRSTLPPSGAASATLLAELAKSICTYAQHKGRAITLADFFSSEKTNGAQIAYVKNAIGDAAYRTFSRLLDGASVEYAPSFTAACEEVYYGRVPYCILPQENSEEGNLSSFIRIAKKYELYPHYTCTVRGESNSTKLALFGHEPCTGVQPKGAKSLKLRLRVSFYAPKTQVIASVACAAAALELLLIKAESAPLEWDEGRYAQTLVFEATNDSLVPFLTYLEIEVPECSDKAVYFEI